MLTDAVDVFILYLEGRKIVSIIKREITSTRGMLEQLLNVP